MKPVFQLRDVGMRYGSVEVLRGVNLDFHLGQMVTIAGPNGAGKSTLLNIMAGLQSRYLGQCLFQDVEAKRWPRRFFARQVSVVPQHLRLEFPFTAEQVIYMGRTPYCDGLFETPDDHTAVERALVITDTVAFRSRDFRSLSGGERQRVVLAAALAQEPRALLLDEPTTFLDLAHQVSIYRLLRDLCRDGMLVVAVTHDLNLAATYSGRLILLHAGRVEADAAPAEVLTRDMIERVFHIDAEIRQGPHGNPWVLYG